MYSCSPGFEPGEGVVLAGLSDSPDHERVVQSGFDKPMPVRTFTSCLPGLRAAFPADGQRQVGRQGLEWSWLVAWLVAWLAHRQGKATYPWFFPLAQPRNPLQILDPMFAGIIFPELNTVFLSCYEPTTSWRGGSELLELKWRIKIMAARVSKPLVEHSCTAPHNARTATCC